MSDPINNINEIKKMMQSSSKFTSISGWSGIWVGVVGLISSFIANKFINALPSMEEYDFYNLELRLFILGLVTLFIAVAGGFYFIDKKSKSEGEKIFSYAGKKIIFKFFQPLFIGGLLILILLYQGFLTLIAPSTLLFYALALLFVSSDTIKEMKYLAWAFVIVALVSFQFQYHGLLFWTIGFGGLHLLFGLLFLLKYDTKK